jgi:serine/threonine protein kinase
MFEAQNVTRESVASLHRAPRPRSLASPRRTLYVLPVFLPSESMDLRSQLQAALGSGYTLDRELGGGGMSRVFVADERRLNRKIVVKVLSPELAQGLSAERFEREIQVAASLQQANIVPVLSSGEMDGLPFYTMPFVEGESLRVRIGTHGMLSMGEAIGVLRDVAKALAYAHQRGVVHRDIKPDNVLVSGGTAVVTDFGIAKAISAARADRGGTLTQRGTSIGTPSYISPEQAAGDPAHSFSWPSSRRRRSSASDCRTGCSRAHWW